MEVSLKCMVAADRSEDDACKEKGWWGYDGPR